MTKMTAKVGGLAFQNVPLYKQIRQLLPNLAQLHVPSRHFLLSTSLGISWLVFNPKAASSYQE
jgi:hypothetical protein